MPRSGALAAAAGPKGKGSGGAMQGRPLRCQHGRRWSQSARARWCCISWRSGGRLAVPGPKSDRAAPSWRGWVAQKSAAHHAMVPMQLNKHCHSRDLAERWRLAYCIILWPLYSQSYRHGNNSCHLGLARPIVCVYMFTTWTIPALPRSWATWLVDALPSHEVLLF